MVGNEMGGAGGGKASNRRGLEALVLAQANADGERRKEKEKK